MTDHSLYDFTRVVLAYFEDIDTPLALGLYLRVKNQMWREAIAVSVDPCSYLYPDQYLRDASASAFLRKCAGLPTGVDTRLPAIEKWWKGERDCYKSNQRLVRYQREFFNSADSDPRIGNFFSTVRKIIFDWIGPHPPLELEGRFGPGATSTDRGRSCTIAHKISAAPSLTAGAIGVLPFWAKNQWGRHVATHPREIELVRGNRFLTVPKTAMIDRCIAAEPSINVFYQLSLGTILRRRLQKATGLDLDNTAIRHQALARKASIDNSLATIDLSNASDTVSIALVKLLMPSSWYVALDSLRSPFTIIDGRSVLLEKFSSMGNGYTFELETIIFLALVTACFKMKYGRMPLIGDEVSCFGDDIIIPDELVHDAVPLLRFCGFTVNTEKSFWGASPFRESCGNDYFRGHFVRPFFVKELPRGPEQWITIANGIQRVKGLIDPYGIDKPFSSWFRALSNLPSQIRRCRGPSALGDVCIHDERERWNYRWRDSVRYFRVYRPSKVRFLPWRLFDPDTVLACAVYGAGNGARGISPRDSVISYSLDWQPYS